MFKIKQDLNVFIRGDIAIRPSSVHGIGVFATKDIPAHVCIEVCPAVVFSKDLLTGWHEEMRYPHILSSHVFIHRSGADGHAIVLGYGSIYNHNIENNAIFRWSENIPEAMEFWSIREIKKDEEIFTRYCNRKEDEWFWVD